MDTAEEFEAIMNMLKHAAEYSLEVEVVHAFYLSVKSRPDWSLSDHVYLALAEWDL